jgi:O-antigen/teichoic acid export membrane protein
VSEAAKPDALLQRVSRAMFWNALMLPGITLVNLAAAVMIRRGFGLESGVYDVALGVLNTLLTHSALGVPLTVAQFVPGLARTAGRQHVINFVQRAAAVRLVLLVIVLVPFNLFAAPLAGRLHLGQNGVWLLHIVSVLALLRAGSDIAIDALQALLAHGLANVVQLAQAVFFVIAVIWTLTVGAKIPLLFAIMAATAGLTTLAAVWLARRQVHTVPSEPEIHAPGAAETPWSRFWGFAIFMYLFDASNYFATPAFASPALAAVSHGPATTALFNVAFQIPMMVVVVILAGFQGLYRPLFAGIMAENSPERVRTAFSEVSKVQAVLLIPAGVGLGLLLPDYITLLFTKQFSNAVPLARILCAFLFLEALLNLGNIILSVDRRYAAALTAQAARVLFAPLFVWLAMRGDIALAAAAFGMGRLVAAGIGFAVARRRYGVRFPVAFAGRICLATALMAAVVWTARVFLPSTWPVTLALTLVGTAVLLAGLRWFNALGPREIDLLRRARLPGSAMILRWVAPADGPALTPSR